MNKFIEEYNGNFTKLEMSDHQVVSALILNETEDKVLVEDHIKCSMITFPIGKVEPGEDLIEALKREIKEETDLDILEAELYCPEFESDMYINGKLVRTYQNLFKVKWTGSPKNMEPNKHRDIFWMPITDLLAYEDHMSFVCEKFVEINKKEMI